LLDCGYTSPDTKQRPYFVMRYFDGKTLEEYVKEHGTLAMADVPEVARQMAAGLHAAHLSNILHRDVKPANVLVRRDATGWQIKLIDFGLAVRQRMLQDAPTCPHGNTILSHSIAGTLDYASPEQRGKLPGVGVGPQADIYSFAKTCCYALFKTTEPTFQDWQKVPREWAKLLGHCLNQNPEGRPSSFAEVLKGISHLQIPERVANILQAHASLCRLHLALNIPPEKLANATTNAQVPADESVLGVIDLTFWGSATNSIIFGTKALYYYDSKCRSCKPNPGTIAYREFPTCDFSLPKNEPGFIRIKDGATLPSFDEELLKVLNLIKQAVGELDDA
jgi:serine/threonine protein kinase